MEVFHGSSKSGLKKLVYKAEYCERVETLKRVEGEGIYLTSNWLLAYEYATKSVYEVQIDDSDILDGTKLEVLQGLISSAREMCEISHELEKGEKIIDACQKVLDGDSALSEFSYSISKVLDNDEGLYTITENTEIVSVLHSLVKRYPVHHSFHKTLGNIYVCFDFSGDCLKIIGERRVSECDECNTKGLESSMTDGICSSCTGNKAVA
jgi:hypothetical protein